MSTLPQNPPTVDTTQQHLIPTFAGTLAGQEQQLVNARELHAFLESKQEFAHWIGKRIEKYGFVEGSDYLIDKIIIQLPSGRKCKPTHATPPNLSAPTRRIFYNFSRLSKKASSACFAFGFRVFR